MDNPPSSDTDQLPELSFLTLNDNNSNNVANLVATLRTEMLEHSSAMTLIVVLFKRLENKINESIERLKI
jgi:hypothetical protein